MCYNVLPRKFKISSTDPETMKQRGDIVPENSPASNSDTFLSNDVRGRFLIWGSIIAFVGFLIPGLYGVNYAPPTGFNPQSIDFSKLKDFNGALSGTNGGVYNGFGGPVDLHPTLYAIIISAILGFIAFRVDLDRAIAVSKNAVSYIPLLKGASISAQLLSLVQLVWGFRNNMIPTEIMQKFITDLGNNQQAIKTAHYLQASLGFGTLIMIFGLLIAFVGITPRVGCALVVGSIALFIIGLIITRIVTGAW